MTNDVAIEDTMQNDQSTSGSNFRQVSQRFEYGCWAALVLFPFLRWINGPAVSTDQFVVQIAIVVAATLGAVGLRIYNLRQHTSGSKIAP